MSVVFDSVVVDINIDIPVFVDSETGVVTVADLIDVSVLEGFVFVEMPNVWVALIPFSDDTVELMLTLILDV